MENTLRWTGIGVGAALLFALVGCSSAQKPAVTSTSSNAAPPATQSAVKPGVQRAQTSSSLQDLQEGRTAATPKDNPLREVYFDFDDYQLKPDARETLKVNSDWLTKNPAVTVQVEGHCDERGTSEYNLALGAKRAQAAKDYLTTLGVASARITTISYGSEIPVCTEHNEACWQKNRRDRFVALSPKPGV
jgi:peptidoglycan-associated lipoprotein